MLLWLFVPTVQRVYCVCLDMQSGLFVRLFMGVTVSSIWILLSHSPQTTNWISIDFSCKSQKKRQLSLGTCQPRAWDREMSPSFSFTLCHSGTRITINSGIKIYIYNLRCHKKRIYNTAMTFKNTEILEVWWVGQLRNWAHIHIFKFLNLYSLVIINGYEWQLNIWFSIRNIPFEWWKMLALQVA